MRPLAMVGKNPEKRRHAKKTARLRHPAAFSQSPIMLT
jgi:hypothetical protein